MDNFLSEKSKESFSSAKFLIDEGHFNSAAHCIYYSCLQLIKYILIDKKFITLDELIDLKIDKKSHKIIWEKLRDNHKLSYPEWKKVNTVFHEIKLVRKSADYDHDFYYNDGIVIDKILKKGNELNTTLRIHFCI